MLCLQCASPLDPAVKFCSTCGLTVPVAPAGEQHVPPPAPVRIAVWMLLISVGLLLVQTLYAYSRIGFARIVHQAPTAILVTVVFLAAWLAAILYLTQRQGWARFVVGGLLLWSVVTLIIGFSRVHWQGMFQVSMMLTWFFVVVRTVAVGLLFTPESEAWYQGGRSAPVGGSAGFAAGSLQ